ncbi:hypothetical protein NEAUS06_1489 [Nematocida ausubeli]|nr:hypothetical protein NEAUS06_1489 [Nematocida ausubeli]
MKIFEEVLPTGIPKDYLASATFSTGVYFITYNSVYKYNTTRSIETYPFSEMPLSFSSVVATAHGEYLIFTEKNTQTIYNPLMNYKSTVTLPNAPGTILVDNYSIVNLFYNEIYIYCIKDMQIRRYMVEQNKLISKYRIRRLYRQEDRVLLMEEKILEINLKIKDRQYQGLGTLSADDKKTVMIRKPVIIEPEPVVFCAEPISEIVCTTWGGIIKYTTGMEVYSMNGENYSLAYIYKTEGTFINGKEQMEVQRRVFVREKEKQTENGLECGILEIGKTGPIQIFSIKKTEKIYVINDTTFLVEGETDRIVRYRTEQNAYQAAPIELSKERDIQKKENNLIETSIEYLRKYKSIKYVLEGATEEENALYIKKILNSFKEDVTMRVMSLGIMLENRIRYVKDVSNEIKIIEKATKEKIKEVTAKNEKIISRMGQIIDEIKHIYERDLQKKEEPSEHIQALKSQIQELKKKVQEPKTTRDFTKLKGEYYLLKEQNRYLMKRLDLLG